MTNPFSPLQGKIFLKLYLSQTISLLSDAFTWVGIALLAVGNIKGQLHLTDKHYGYVMAAFGMISRYLEEPRHGPTNL